MTTTEVQVSAAKSDASKLDRSMVRAIAWSGAAQWVVQIFSWVSTIYVARVLTPVDYGVFAMAMMYLGLISLVSEFGVGSAVVVLRDLGARELAELNTISLMAGLLWFVISWTGARSIGAFFSSGELPMVILAMSVAFVIGSIKVVPESLLQQELRFRLLAGIDAARAFLQAAATMVSASFGWGYWSLAVGYLVGTTVGTVLTVAARIHPFALPRLRSLRPALNLSRNLLVIRIGWYLYSNADFLIAGRMLGEASLGAYRLAWSVSNIPADKITTMVNRTSQAFFSVVQRDYELLRRYLLAVTQGLGLVAIPASVGLSLVSNQFVALVLGSKWDGVASPLRLLALFVAVRTVAPLISTVLSVTGNSGFLAWNSFVMSLVMPFGFYLGAKWGTSGIAAAWVVMYPLCLAPLYWRALDQIQLPLRQYFDALWGALGGTSVMTVVVLGLKYSLPAQWTLLIQLSLQIGAGVITYLAFIFFFHHNSIQKFWNTVALLRGSEEEGPA